MANTSNFMLNLSVLHRNTQKFFDRVLAKYDIGSGQILFLMFINENEGTTMQEVTRVSEVDKGTTTKSINRLIEQGYVQARTDEHDRRVKRLYTTDKAAEIMNTVYEYRNECRKALSNGVDFVTFENMLSNVTENSRTRLEEEVKEPLPKLRIGGLQKTTLLDYPGKVASTVFTAGCSFKCPYCHNRNLVYIPENYEFIDQDDVLSFLDKRKKILDGVCVSGGEPMMQAGLVPFLQKIRELGLSIKLDITGNWPDKVKEIVELNLVDFIAMDIKNAPAKYAETVGMDPETFNLEPIRRTVEYLKTCGVPFEFRTTVVKEMHTVEDIEEIGKWIGDVENYYLQQFSDSGNLIQEGFHPCTKEEMEEMRQAVMKYVPRTQLRGVREV